MKVSTSFIDSFLQDDFDLSFKVFRELMPNKVEDILLVSSPYDAFIMEEDGRLLERIVHEYRGLNLSRPPMLKWVPTSKDALKALSQKKYDLVISMPRQDDMAPYEFGLAVKAKVPGLPVFLLVHNASTLLQDPKCARRDAIDGMYVWSGNTDILLALIKSVEDRMNLDHDIQRGWVRVIILVEDSPMYLSSILPLLYKVIVMQTQLVIEDSVNEEHRVFRMRARPKILVAETYDDALKMFNDYHPYVLSVISDVRYPKACTFDDSAGVTLLSEIKENDPDIPLLLLSSEEKNRVPAEKIPAVFLNKNSPSLHREITDFFTCDLGFGDFVFRLSDGTEIARAGNLKAMEEVLPRIPEESVQYHASHNHFSTWLMARSEIKLASKLRPLRVTDFLDSVDLKTFLIRCIHERRKGRHKGVIADFHPDFDPETEMVKIGAGSLGGKARGLAFTSTLLKRHRKIIEKYDRIDIRVPRMMIITTQAFDGFIEENKLKDLSTKAYSDKEVFEKCLAGELPVSLQRDLERFLALVDYPLAVRSSSLLEDSMHQPFAGIYRTYMLPNCHPDLKVRHSRLMEAVKLVYASTYLAAPKSYSRSTMHRMEEEKMAVILQELMGRRYGDYFYPAVSGVAQSFNFYPIGPMKPEDGLVHFAMGLGKTVVEGEASLHFCPKYPQFLPQFSTVEDILQNSQRYFYGLNMTGFPEALSAGDDPTLEKLEIDEIEGSSPLNFLAGTYIPEEHRIRDSSSISGERVLTFANILKYKVFPLPELLHDLLELVRYGMGSPVEIEFALNLPQSSGGRPELAVLQTRPMGSRAIHEDVRIEEEEIKRAFCYSAMALGNGRSTDMVDIVYVKPETFDTAKTIEIAREIGVLNRDLVKESRKYLLIGFGRWGSADRWLGIPVHWNDISAVGTVIETSIDTLNADPSQGSHFFHNIASLGINYLTILNTGDDFIRWELLENATVRKETTYLRWATLNQPLTQKIDGKTSRAVIIL